MTPQTSSSPDPDVLQDTSNHFDWVAIHDTKARRHQRFFHQEIAALLKHHIPEGSRVVEWGCGAGDLLAALNPSRGLGLDTSAGMLNKAKLRYQTAAFLEFREGDAHKTIIDENFDVIVLDYLTGYLTDIQRCLENLQASAHCRTRLYITSLNTLWRPVLSLAQQFGLVMKQPPSNWLSSQDLHNLLELAGWEVILSTTEVMCPLGIPFLRPLLNRWLVRLPFLKHFGSTLFIVARPNKKPRLESDVTCSVIVPVRNEAGNIRSALERIPTLGKRTEVIFVEGNSEDGTWDVVREECKGYTGPHLIAHYKQPRKGKWDAVTTGFERAQGDVLVIQDGDLTVRPEELEKFFECITNGYAELANGCRLVYPMEEQAIRFLNLLGNKLFAVMLSAVLRQPVKDSLCGTKMILRSDYKRLCERIKPFGNVDPFGDFTLLYGAALLDLKIRDIPIVYKKRTYGKTNISRFRHGWQLLKMVIYGLKNLRFHPLRLDKVFVHNGK